MSLRTCSGRSPTVSWWGDVISQKTPLGVPRFPSLARVRAMVLSLLHSNADCERAFSMVWKVHTECHMSLCAETVTAFWQCKINFNADCCEFAVTPAMLCYEAKYATTTYNREHENKWSASQEVVFCCYRIWVVYGCVTGDSRPTLCFVMLLTIYMYFWQIFRIFCHDRTDMSCPRLSSLQ